MAIGVAIVRAYGLNINAAINLMFYCYLSHRTEAEEWLTLLTEENAEAAARERVEIIKKRDDYMREKLCQRDAYRREKAADEERQRQAYEEREAILLERFGQTNRNGTGDGHAE
jgi:hypothetical protein